MESDENFLNVKAIITLPKEKSNSLISLSNDQNFLAILTTMLPQTSLQTYFNLEILNFINGEYIKKFEQKFQSSSCSTFIKFSQNSYFLYIILDSNSFGVNIITYSTATNEVNEQKITKSMLQILQSLNFESFNESSVNLCQMSKKLYDKINKLIPIFENKELKYKISLFDINQTKLVMLSQNDQIYIFYRRQKGLKLLAILKQNIYLKKQSINLLKILQHFLLYQVFPNLFKLIYIQQRKLIRKFYYKQGNYFIRDNDFHLISIVDKNCIKISLLNFSMKNLNNINQYLSNSYFTAGGKIIKSYLMNRNQEQKFIIIE